MTARMYAMLEALVLVVLWGLFCGFIGYHIESKKVDTLTITTKNLESANDSAQQTITQYVATVKQQQTEIQKWKDQVSTAADVLQNYKDQITALQAKDTAKVQQAEKTPACAAVLKEQLCPALLGY